MEHTDHPDFLNNNGLSFFRQHGSSILLSGRNSHLGALLTSERAFYYLNILYRLLLFKRDYELEPLYEDIFQEIFPPQSLLDSDYNQAKFRYDIDQLTSWGLISFRIEKQRLRGYRDNRKRKFRYRLTNEVVTFLEWLEQRYLDDIQSRGNDTRDLLGESRGSLGELLRLLHLFKEGEEGSVDTARRVLFQLFKTGDLCQEISVNLADLNGRLLFFLVQHYQIDDVRKLIGEIESYVDNFLQQIFKLRREIVPLLERLRKESNINKILECHRIMETERQRTPNLLQSRRMVHVAAIPENLQVFFEEQGSLDKLLQRINNASMKVWQKLRSHLRELERKNNRLQDIRCRIEEIGMLDEQAEAAVFMNDLLGQPLCCFDPNYWDKEEKAEPPIPRRRLSRQSEFPKQYLGRKKSQGTIVESMEEARLSLLQRWIRENIPFDAENRQGLLSHTNISCFDDFTKIIELGRAGLLTDGKRLARLHYTLTPEEQRILLFLEAQQLHCPELIISLLSTSTEKSWK
ncbi:MAG: DUF2397 family protein [Desulfobulbaceae bacterium]|nr:DUF2397 family protein [Desulfobulbaceae bacterium]